MHVNRPVLSYNRVPPASLWVETSVRPCASFAHMQAQKPTVCPTFLSPLWVLRGRRVTPQRATTPSVPRPLVMAMVSSISSLLKMLSTVTSCSNSLVAKSTLSATSPPLTYRHRELGVRHSGTPCRRCASGGAVPAW